MKFTPFILMLLSAALASAQTITSPPALPSAAQNCNSARLAVPTCGLSCLSSAASAIGCAASNATCICAQAPAVEAKAEDCVISACGGIASAYVFSNASHTVCLNCA